MNLQKKYPRQRDGYNCGVFVIAFGRVIANHHEANWEEAVKNAEVTAMHQLDLRRTILELLLALPTVESLLKVKSMCLYEDSDDDSCEEEEEEVGAGAPLAVEEEEAARVKAAEEEAARLKAAEEEAARLKARVTAAVEEAARLKAVEEEAAKVKAAEEEAARLKAVEEEAARVKAAEEEAARLKAARLKEKEDLAHEFAQALLSLGNGDSAPYKVVTSETAMKEMVTKFLKAAARQDNPNVTVGWHWTSARNVEKIKKAGLLNEAERKLVDPLYSAAVHGSCYGDGVYMGETANSFSGQYGDTCLFCLILRGNERQLTSLEEGYQYHFSQFYAASAENRRLDTVVGNKTRGGPVVDREKNEVDCYLRAHYVLLTLYSRV
jgi:hypothetical protein